MSGLACIGKEICKVEENLRELLEARYYPQHVNWKVAVAEMIR
jgi:hypothetical protein